MQYWSGSISCDDGNGNPVGHHGGVDGLFHHIRVMFWKYMYHFAERTLIFEMYVVDTKLIQI